MAVTFILGRAGSGKTHACVAGVLAALAEQDSERRLILLVPEQASLQMERALALGAPGRGLWRAEVLSFSRLAWRILSATDGPELLGSQARRLALRCVTRACGDALVALRRSARTEGFYAELDRLIEELISENVTPAELRAAALRLPNPRWAAKAGEVADLYDAYLAWLGPRRGDEAARLALLRERLAQLPWLPTASIWVDGFAGFTGQEAATLAALARHARDLHIALLLDPHAPAVTDPGRSPDPIGLFQRTEATYQTLLRMFAAEGIEVTPPVVLTGGPLPRFREAPRLAALEAALAAPFGVPAAPPPPSPARVPAEVRIVRCATHRAELRAAARWIRATIAESAGRLRFRDFAVIARDLGPLAETVAEVFGEFEIPYFLDRRRPMRAHPLARLVPALFDAVRTDLGTTAAVRLLRTRLLPLTRDAAEQLENLIVRFGFAGLRLWQQPEWPVERGATVPAFAKERAAVATALAPLYELARQDPPPTGAAWARAVLAALEALGVRRTVDGWRRAAYADGDYEAAELHRLAWDALAGVLQDVHTVLPDTPLAAGELADIVGGALRELTLGLAPPTLDQVLVGSIERSRHPDLQFAWLLAFNEGVFPARPPADPLLTADERDALAAAGLPAPAARRDDAYGERLLAYIACTRPARGLTISYAAVSDDGDELQPSPLLTDIRAALPDLAEEEDEAWPPPVTLADLAEGLLAARADPRYARHRQRHERLLAAARTDAAAAARLDRLLRGLSYANDPGPVALCPGDPPLPTFSPSRIETYIQCPFRYFAQYALRLDAQRGPHPLRWDLGTLAHELLAAVVRAAMQRGDVTSLSEEVWDELTAAAVEQYRCTQPPDLPERRPDFAFLSEVLLTRLRDVVRVHTARWQRGDFRPRGCEERIDDGPGATRPPITLRLADGRGVRIVGKIDRLDVAETPDGPLLLIYDYKSGAVGPPPKNFLTGAALQLFTYMLAWGGAPAAEGRVGGVLLAPLYPNMEALEKAAGDGLPPDVQLMHAYKPRGLVTEEAAFQLDTSLLPGTSTPVGQLRVTKSGKFHQSDDAVKPERLAGYAQLAEATVRQAAEGLLAGTISVAPLVEKRRLACGTCDFRDVCRFDRAFNRPRAAESALPPRAGVADGGDDE